MNQTLIKKKVKASFSFKITCKKPEEEEEEEDGVQENGILPPDDLESYEIKAERVLEEQRERVSIAPELDYIDEEDEDVQPQVIEHFLTAIPARS